MKKIIVSAVLLLISSVFFAQEKRDKLIPVDLLFGHKRVNLSFSMNKTIDGNFRFMNSTSAAAYYDYLPGKTEIVSTSSLVYQFHKNVGVSGGMQYHFAKGFIPNVAVHFSHANPTWLLSLTPYYNFMPWNSLEAAGLVEFKPALSENLRLFTRIQGFYSHDLEKNERERGILNFRLGLTVKKYTVGLGSNFDYYRPSVNEIQNFGGFVRVDI